VTVNPATPSLVRRLLCLVYEALLLTAVVFLAGGTATALARVAALESPRLLTQTTVLLLCIGYFVIQWQRSGQTLPMKTWHIRLVSRSGARITWGRAALRLALAAIGYLALGITVLWALADRDRQFLHDRLAGTRLITLPAA